MRTTGANPNHAKKPILSRGSRGSRFKKKTLRRGFGCAREACGGRVSFATLRGVPSKQEDFMAELERLIARAKQLLVAGFRDTEPEEATKLRLLEPLFQALGYLPIINYDREFKISLDSVDYMLKSDRPAHVRGGQELA
jgi:hypothetical protein